MAGNAVIGALRVTLGLDSAQFQTGLKQSQSRLERFGVAATAAFAAVAAAGAAAAIALSRAVRSAADHADELGKTAQKVGVTVEALSRLEYAARLSDVSLETLSTGLRKLSQNMLEVASGRGAQAKASLDALGISVTDATGRLKSADAVLAEVADRFGRMEDSSTKTALAMNLFGRSGSELIPLLNSGTNGLQEMADEADRLGLTISTRTAKAAEGFNDSLTRINASFEGIANRLLTQVTPQMEQLAETISDPTFQQSVVDLTTMLVEMTNWLARAGQLAVELGRVFPKPIAPNEDRDLYNIPGYAEMIEAAQNRAGFSGVGSMPSLSELLEFGKPGSPGGGGGESNLFEPIIVGARRAQEAIDPFAARMQELSGYLTATHDPFEQMKLDLTDLKTTWEQGRISTEQYGEAVRRVNTQAAISTMDSVASITSSLAGMFQDNKAIAAANTIVSTAAGAMKAFEQGGILGFAGAAAVIAAGAAQLHTILSTNVGSTSMPSAPSAPVAAAADVGASTAVNVTLHGDRVGRESMQQLFDDLTEMLADKGVTFNLSPVGA